MEKHPTNIVVVGAGYAGLLATVRLAGKVKREIKRGEIAITLVNAADVFIERLRLHQFAAAWPMPYRPISQILDGTGVTFMRGLLTGIDAAQHDLTLETDTGSQNLHYDQLVYALGSLIERDSVPGVREYAYVLTPSGLHSAAELREILPMLNARSGRLLVCGGGATGIEAAAQFADMYPNLHVQLITRDRFGSFTKQKITNYMRRSLDRLGVAIRDQTTIIEVNANEAVSADGAVFPFDVCVWAGGFTVPNLAREAGLAVNKRGQILIDPFMRSISHPEIYALGDAAYPIEPPGVPAVRMSAVTAAMMGAHGADCISAFLHGKMPKAFSFAYPGQAIALGQRNAIGFNNYPDDNQNPPYFTGEFGYAGREFFVRLLANLPNFERRWPGISNWLGKGRYATQHRKQANAAQSTSQSLPRAPQIR